MSHSGTVREEAVRQGLTGCVGLRPEQMVKQKSLSSEKEAPGSPEKAAHE